MATAKTPLMVAGAAFTVHFVRSLKGQTPVYAGGGGWSYVSEPTPAQLQASAARLAATETELAATQEKLTAAKKLIADTQAELQATREDLASAKAQLSGQAIFDGGVLSVRNADGRTVHIDLESMEYSIADQSGTLQTFTGWSAQGHPTCTDRFEIGTKLSSLESCTP